MIKSSTVRLSFYIEWLKSTMMKSIIRGNVDTETKATHQAFVDTFVKGKGNSFVEKKPPAAIERLGGKKKSSMYESSQHLKKVAERDQRKRMKEEEAKQEEERKKAKEMEGKRHDAQDNLEYVKLLASDIFAAIYFYA